MSNDPLEKVTTLTFDIFGTVLDLAGSLRPGIEHLLSERDTNVSAGEFWAQWRTRQRLEQWQDSILMAGHSGYLETCRRALLYTLRSNGMPFAESDVDRLMGEWQGLTPFEDAVPSLPCLAQVYRLVALSNGDRWYLEHLVESRIRFPFDAVISVDEVGAFKPHPSVYRMAVRRLDVDPSEVMMVAAHSFDIVGARMCGFRGIYVDRYGAPFDESPYRPDIVVADFAQLADRLVGTTSA